MPELFRLQTPDYEFSVWSSDISQRVKMYNTTMARSSSLTTSSSMRMSRRIMPLWYL